MSNERNQDDRVSAAYKDLATERTPEHLDNKILAMAAGKARRPAYSRWMSWSRPVALAATITLCLAISFELLRDPSVQPAAVSGREESRSALPQDLRENDLEESEIENSPAARQDARVPSISAQSDAVNVGAAEQDEPKAQDDAFAGAGPADFANDLIKNKETAKREADQQWSNAEPELQQAVAESIANTSASDKADVARMRSSAEAAPAESTTPAAAPVKAPATAPAADMRRAEKSLGITSNARVSSDDADTPVCAEERRATAETWHACIVELQAAGNDIAAEREREALIDTFPDFKLP